MRQTIVVSESFGVEQELAQLGMTVPIAQRVA